MVVVMMNHIIRAIEFTEHNCVEPLADKALLLIYECFMFYVLCFMFYVLCFMFYVLCFMFYSNFSLYSVFLYLFMVMFYKIDLKNILLL